MDPGTRELVRQRAGLRREYCHLPENLVPYLVYHVDHIVAKQHLDEVSDDPEFGVGVKTIFNNDHDNSARLGMGKDLEEIEVEQGHLIDAKGIEGRYVRLYSNGSTADEFNHYIEVEVFGLPVGK